MSADEGSFSDLPVLTPVEIAAADWVLRRQKGLSAKEERAFRDWLEAPAHQAVYLEMAETSHRLDGLKFDVPEGTIPFEAPPSLPVKRTARWRLGVAVACTFLAAGLAWSQLRSDPQKFAATWSTEIGGLQRLELPDGSVVQLNTDSAVRVTYQPRERRLTLLHGEAYFTVAKNPERPFWVEAGPVAVRAVGTAFNIRMQPDAVDVLVTEGKVRVVDGDGRAVARDKSVEELGPLLTSGHLGQIPLGGKKADPSQAMVVTEMAPQTLKTILAWQKGRLEFVDRPLSEVVAEFNRYNAHKIVIADAKLAEKRFGGAFASHQIAPLLELLEQSFGVVVEERGDESVLHRAN